MVMSAMVMLMVITPAMVSLLMHSDLATESSLTQHNNQLLNCDKHDSTAGEVSEELKSDISNQNHPVPVRNPSNQRNLQLILLKYLLI